jgi:hypothetical protein
MIDLFKIFSGLFCRGLGTANETKSEIKSFGYTLKEANRAKDIHIDFKAAVNELKNLDKAAVGLTSMNSEKVTEWGFFKNTLLESRLKGSEYEWLLKMDKNLLDTGMGKGLVKSLGGEVKTVAGAAEKIVEGTAGAKIAANTLGKISLLNLGFSAALEVPEIIEASKHGDGLNQVGRSGVKIGFSTFLIGLGSSIGKALPTKYKFIASLIGGAIGGMVGNKAGEITGEALFGKPVRATA